jgi:hypothetical protein
MFYFMAKVIILGARLSTNPATAKIEHPQGLNGICNVTGSGKKFYVVDATVLKGTVPVTKSTIVWADANGRFPLSVEDYNKYNQGSMEEGELVKFENLAPYKVDGKEYTNVTLLVMKGQKESDVLNDFVKRQINSGSRSTSTGAGKGAATPPDDNAGEIEAAEKELQGHIAGEQEDAPF